MLTTQVLAVAVSFNCIILVALKFAVGVASLFYYKARYICVYVCAACCTPPIVQIQHYQCYTIVQAVEDKLLSFIMYNSFRLFYYTHDSIYQLSAEEFRER